MTEKEFREYRDYMVSVHAAKDSWDTIRDEGWAEGRAKGLAEGRAEGRAEGERHKALELARRMKTKGYPMEDIIEITGLTAETISSL